MTYYNVCVGNNDFIKNASFDLTDNRMYAMRFKSLEVARKVATAAKAIFNKPSIIDEFNIYNPQDLLEFLRNETESVCGEWAADISIDYDNNRILIFCPNGLKTYEIKITEKFVK